MGEFPVKHCELQSEVILQGDPLGWVKFACQQGSESRRQRKRYSFLRTMIPSFIERRLMFLQPSSTFAPSTLSTAQTRTTRHRSLRMKLPPHYQHRSLPTFTPILNPNQPKTPNYSQPTRIQTLSRQNNLRTEVTMHREIPLQISCHSSLNLFQMTPLNPSQYPTGTVPLISHPQSTFHNSSTHQTTSSQAQLSSQER